MSDANWKISEVISYLELKIKDEVATDKEMEMYEKYKWDNKVNKQGYVYKRLVREMMDEYEGN